MKFVFLLRNPIDRAYSHWTMESNRKRESHSFLKAIKRELKYRSTPDRTRSYIRRGLYSHQITRFIELFGKDQILLLKYDDYNQNQKESIGSVLSFLGVDCSRFEFKEERKLVTRYNREMTDRERGVLLEIYDEEISRLETLTGWDCTDWLGLK